MPQVSQPLGRCWWVAALHLRPNAVAFGAAVEDDAQCVVPVVGLPALETGPAYHPAMPIKLWSDEAQNFVDARTREPVIAEELVDLVVAYRTLPADRQAVRKAYVEALLARQGGRKPH